MTRRRNANKDGQVPKACTLCNMLQDSRIPGNVKDAIKQFLEFGRETTGESHNGYYGPGGWPYETLKKHIGLED